MLASIAIRPLWASRMILHNIANTNVEDAGVYIKRATIPDIRRTTPS